MPATIEPSNSRSTIRICRASTSDLVREGPEQARCFDTGPITTSISAGTGFAARLRLGAVAQELHTQDSLRWRPISRRGSVGAIQNLSPFGSRGGMGEDVRTSVTRL